ncbi:hypothetical protein J3F84DRAFT_354395 [Trichoderma pleuroticola]
MYIVSAHLPTKSKRGAKKSAPKLTRGLLIVPALSHSARQSHIQLFDRSGLFLFASWAYQFNIFLLSSLASLFVKVRFALVIIRKFFTSVPGLASNGPSLSKFLLDGPIDGSIRSLAEEEIKWMFRHCISQKGGHGIKSVVQSL